MKRRKTKIPDWWAYGKLTVFSLGTLADSMCKARRQEPGFALAENSLSRLKEAMFEI